MAASQPWFALTLASLGAWAAANVDRIVVSVSDSLGNRATEFRTAAGEHRLEVTDPDGTRTTFRGGREPAYVPVVGQSEPGLVFRIEDGPLTSVVWRAKPGAQNVDFVGAKGYVVGAKAVLIPNDAALSAISLTNGARLEFRSPFRIHSPDVISSQRGGKWFLRRLSETTDAAESATPFLAANETAWLTAESLNGQPLDLPEGYAVDPAVPLETVGERTMLGIVRRSIDGVGHTMFTAEPTYPWVERAERYRMLSDGFQIENGPWRAPLLGTNFAVLEEALQRPWPAGAYRRRFWRVDLRTHDYTRLEGEGLAPGRVWQNAAWLRTSRGFTRVDLASGAVESLPWVGDARVEWAANANELLAVARHEVVRLTRGTPERLSPPGASLRFSATQNPASTDADQTLLVRVERSVGGQVGVARLMEGQLRIGSLAATLVARRSRTGIDYLFQDLRTPPQVVEGPDDPTKVLVVAPGQNPPLNAERTLLSAKVNGQEVAATLLTPAGQAEELRPLVIHIYDRMAGRGFEYPFADAQDPHSVRNWLDMGFAVLLPDLAFTVGKPGASVVSSLRAWLKELRKRGPLGRVAVVGHSWGGYGALFAATQMPELRCVVAGSPLTDLRALYYLSYAGNQPNGPILQFEQGRMGTTPEADPAAYRANSPLTFLKGLKVPVLAAFGDRDELVHPSQHEMLAHALWEFGRVAQVVRYPGEGHGLSRPATRADHRRRVDSWLRQHLRGELPD